METPTFGEKFRALLASGRVANLPTVWSNILVAFWLGFIRGGGILGGSSAELILPFLALPLIIASCLYLGGCLIGDWRDIGFDREHRPNRPLPLGVLSPSFVALSGLSLVALGLVLSFVGTPALAVYLYYDDYGYPTFKELLSVVQLHEIVITSLLATCILCYAFLHKKNKAIALLLMASCRGLLILFAFTFSFKTYIPADHENFLIPQFDWLNLTMVTMAAAVAIYTLLLSWVASTESSPEKFSERNILAVFLILLPGLSWLAFGFSQKEFGASPSHYLNATVSCPSLAFYFAITACYLAWIYLALRAVHVSKPRFVSMALAGFCLLDACFAATFSIPIAIACLVFFLFSLLLQKVTPAT